MWKTLYKCTYTWKSISVLTYYMYVLVIHMYACVPMKVYICSLHPLSMLISMYVYAFMYIYINAYTYIDISILTLVYMYINACICIYVHIHKCKYVYTDRLYSSQNTSQTILPALDNRKYEDLPDLCCSARQEGIQSSML